MTDRNTGPSARPARLRRLLDPTPALTSTSTTTSTTASASASASTDAGVPAPRALVPLDRPQRSTPPARSDSLAPHVNADADADVIVDVNVDVDVDAPPVSRPWLEVPVSRTAEYFRRAYLAHGATPGQRAYPSSPCARSLPPPAALARAARLSTAPRPVGGSWCRARSETRPGLAVLAGPGAVRRPEAHDRGPLRSPSPTCTARTQEIGSTSSCRSSRSRSGMSATSCDCSCSLGPSCASTSITPPPTLMAIQC